ncbi:MAG TPA: hypothetical protein VJM12_13575 [Pyrinomonadaceae bacterium]|nr:hypothetical protein [Pyrinomonadaceae bacterium]
MNTHNIAAVFHPGELSVWELAGIVAVFFAICMLPIVIIGFIIYRVAARRSGDSESITLSLNSPGLSEKNEIENASE